MLAQLLHQLMPRTVDIGHQQHVPGQRMRRAAQTPTAKIQSDRQIISSIQPADEPEIRSSGSGSICGSPFR